MLSRIRAQVGQANKKEDTEKANHRLHRIIDHVFVMRARADGASFCICNDWVLTPYIRALEEGVQRDNMLNRVFSLTRHKLVEVAPFNAKVLELMFEA